LSKASGRSLAQLASELGVSRGSLVNWISQADVNEGKTEGLTSDERDELRRLRREVKVLAEVREILKKGRGLLREGRREPAMIFTFIAAKKAEHSIKIMCRVLEVSRSGYHAWPAPGPQGRATHRGL